MSSTTLCDYICGHPLEPSVLACPAATKGLLCRMCDLHNTLHIIEFIIHDGLKAIGYLDVKIKFAKRLAVEGNGSLDETLAEDISTWECEKTTSLKGMHDMVLRESRQYTSRWTPASPPLSPTTSTPGTPKRD